MALAPGRPEPKYATTIEGDLRSKIKELIHERDAALTKSERSQTEAAELRAVMRHVLTVSCENCKVGRLTLALGAAVDDGKHAAGIYAAGLAMGWRFGQPTLGALFQMMNRPQPAAFGVNDECPTCAAMRLDFSKESTSRHDP